MIKEAYCSYEVARLLKEKGFDWECIGYYVDDEPDDIKYSLCGETNTIWEKRCCSAPTHQMAMKWLREVYHLEICPNHDSFQEHCEWWFRIDKFTKGYFNCLYESDSVYFTYEEACEAAIQYCLENLI